MFTFLFIISCLIFVLLVLVASMKPVRSNLSEYELERRAGAGDKDYQSQLELEHSLDDIQSLLRIKTALLLVVFVIMSVLTFDWFIGITISVIVALEYGVIARLKFVRATSMKLYERLEPTILKTVNKFPGVMRFLRTAGLESPVVREQIDSIEELQFLVQQSSNVMSSQEKKLIVSGLSFSGKTVDSIMTPKSMINSIKKSEFLGPLTLNDLHKTGHSRLPVIDKDIDHIVGILNLKSLLTLDIKRSMTAEKAMDAMVYYVREDQTLAVALAAFLRTHHHLFVVVNEYRETVGLLALEDVIEALIGHKIVDEFDAHDDLRAVALRNPSANNEPQNGQNI